MTKEIRFLNIRALFVLRHRWEKDRDITNYEVWNMRRRYKLGLWFKKSRVVGPVRKGKNTKETAKNTFNESNLVNSYMIGLELIVCKMWMTLQFKPTLTLKT
jgi:hypothetical protein